MLSAMLVITPCEQKINQEISSRLIDIEVALMSRPVAGTRNKTLIITLPGSPKGAKENLQSIIKLLPHACIQAAGADSRALHKGGVERLEREAGIKSGHGTKSTGHTHSPDHGHGHHRISKSHTDPASRPKSNDPNADPTRRYRESPYPMLSVAEALDIIESETPPPNAIQLPVKIDLGGFVLAEDITANEPVPAFRASIVDGYAVNVGPNGANEKGIFPVASVSHATAGEINLLPSGQIARVTTGAPLPPGSNAVVMVEDTLIKDTTEDSKEEKSIEILTDEVKAGENVREIGSDIKAGSVILRKGEEITAVGGELGLLASVGSARVSVYKKPRIGVLSTGDEIVQHDRPEELLLGEVRDCNRPTIMSAADGWGFEVVDLGITKDRYVCSYRHSNSNLSIDLELWKKT
jgi:gephyrin